MCFRFFRWRPSLKLLHVIPHIRSKSLQTPTYISNMTDCCGNLRISYIALSYVCSLSLCSYNQTIVEDEFKNNNINNNNIKTIKKNKQNKLQMVFLNVKRLTCRTQCKNIDQLIRTRWEHFLSTLLIFHVVLQTNHNFTSSFTIRNCLSTH